MAAINILSPHVADLIAAGEVVERPASVIKELVENSLDAGAHNITVEIKDGGATFIRVTDDGCGMAPEDAGVAFLRHATSKLHDEKGLEAIGTMGFRGEALAAISAVSLISLTTRRKGDNEGTEVTLTAGDIDNMTPIGCPEGTTIVVKNLFYNTPARLKFLKSDRSESSACIATALKCALGHPEVSVRFIRDGKDEFFSPGDGKQESCAYTLLGRELASTFLQCNGEDEGLKVTGFVSSPKAGRGNRSSQFFFVNGRAIRSALLQAAVEQAYKNTLLTGRYPACVLYITMGLGSVDVNVHPTKAEIKFSQEKKVFDLVYYAVLSALDNERPAEKIELSASTKAVAKPSADFYKSMSSEQFRANGYSAAPAKAEPKIAPAPAVRYTHTPTKGADYIPTKGIDVTSPKPIYSAFPKISPEKKRDEQDALIAASAEIPYQTSINIPTAIETNENGKDFKDSVNKKQDLPQGCVENSVQNVESPPVPHHNIVGETMKTYIIVEQGDSMILIDKHAAHERMIFDRLKRQEREIMAQTLLVPITFRPGREDGELLEKNAELLTRMGFEVDNYGDEDFIVRAVPADMDSGDVVPAIEEICDKLRRGRGLDPNSIKDEVLHTVACKAAIKAGWDTDRRELQCLVDAVLSGEVKYCPHGRPVSVMLTRKDLDKMFKRIV